MRGATLKQLRAFSLLARQMSFAQVAATLHLTPSAVSLQIKELEMALGVRLFARRGGAVSITPAGEALLGDVQRALSALQDADEKLTRLRGEARDRVSVGMVSNAEYFLPRLLADFHALRHDVDLRIVVGNRQQLLERLCRGEVDFAVMGAPPADLDACVESFAFQPLAIVAAPSHVLSGVPAIPARSLCAHAFVARESGSGTRAAMERFFRDEQIEPPRVIEMTSNESIKQAVIARMGLAFLSLHSAGRELRESSLVRLDIVGLPIIRPWNVVNIPAAPLHEAARSVQRHIVERGHAAIAAQFADLGPSTMGSLAPAWDGIRDGG